MIATQENHEKRLYGHTKIKKPEVHFFIKNIFDGKWIWDTSLTLNNLFRSGKYQREIIGNGITEKSNSLVLSSFLAIYESVIVIVYTYENHFNNSLTFQLVKV